MTTRKTQKKMTQKQQIEARNQAQLNHATETAQKTLWNTFLALSDLKENVWERDPHVISAHLEILETYVSEAHELLSMARLDVRGPR